MKIERKLISLAGSLFFLFTSCFDVCSLNFKNFDLLCLIFSFILLVIGGTYKKLTYSNFFTTIFVLFYCPMFLSFLWAILKIAASNDSLYYDYVSSIMITRFIHILFYSIIFYGIIKTIDNIHNPNFISIFPKSYAYGIFIILGLMGFWQILHQVTGIWCPEIKTRNEMYFASSLDINRITSFADEPSYLVPFLLDAIIIALFFNKKIIAISLLVLLGFSFSLGGYFEFLLLSLFLFWHLDIKSKYKSLGLMIVSIGLILLMYPSIIDIFKVIIESRKELQEGASLSDTSRTVMFIQCLNGFFESDIVSQLLGNGPSSIKYFYNTNPGKVIFPTTNNFYLDSLYESGLIGVIAFCILFYYLWKECKRVYKRGDIITIIPQLFMLHIAFSSMYRADYSSARFTAIFIVLFCMIIILKEKKRNNYYKNGLYNYTNLSA